MNKQDVVKIQSFVLKVNVHCDGCKQKIKKQLQRIEGVYKISIDAEQGKVMVSGTVDPSTLIKKLEKSGKHAVLCGPQKGSSNNIQNPPKNLFHNIPLDNFKGGKDNKSQKGGSGKDQPKQHLPQHQQQQQLHQLQMIQQLKGNIKDQKVPSKDPRTVKFNLPEEDFGGSDYDSYDDEFDEFDDEFDEFDYDEDFDDEEFGGHQHHNLPTKMIPITGKESNGMMNGQSKNDKGQKGGGGGGKNGKKGEVFDVMKDMGGKKEKSEKIGGMKDKKKGSGGNGTGKIGGFMNMLRGMGGKNDVKSVGKNGGGGKNKSGGGGGGGNKGSGNGGNGKGNGKKDGGKNEGSHGMKNAFPDHNVLKQGKVVGGPNQQMGNFPALQGQPAFAAAMNGSGYYPGMNQGMWGNQATGMGLPAANPYNNQQYMAMMMNQQRTNTGSEMLHPMMYSRPPPPMGYMPPPMPSHPMADPYTHIFNDENTDSCSIM